MKNILNISLLLFVLTSWAQGFGTFGGAAQSEEVKDPTTWSYRLSSSDLHVGDEVEIFYEVSLEDKWVIYGTSIENGPIPTEFVFEKNNSFTLIGNASAVNPEKYYDEGFGINIPAFHNKGKFKQRIKILEKQLNIKVKIEYQVCTTSCYSFNHELQFEQKVKPSKKTDKKEKNTTGPITPKTKNTNNKTSTVDCDCDDIKGELSEIKQTLNGVNGSKISASQNSETIATSSVNIPRKPGFFDIVVNRFGGEQTKQKEDFASLFMFMGIAFLSGLLALLTPCVFPLIPMTVSFFTKGAHGDHKGFKNALFYGVFIILIFTMIGIAFSKIFGDQVGNIMSVHWIPNLLFFLIFVIFALSFLGWFEITLPSSFVNKIDAKSEKQGLGGVFFMAMTLVLVTFSCTGPIVSTILIQSAGGSWLMPIFGMFGFSFALALPFTIFAAFPSLLKNLPRSGGWLNSVKVVLGFLELALAFKFLSQIDLVYGFDMLNRDVFLIIWIVIFAVMAFYILGKIRLPHDSPLEHLTVFRLLMALVTFAFTIYLTLGLLGAPLKMMSGVLPPMYTQEFNLMKQDKTENYICEEPMYGQDFHMPHNLQGYYDLRQAISCAIEQGKPIFLDYTGKGCSNCRMFENNIWANEKNLELMKNDYVVLAMYGDHSIPLAKGEEFKIDGVLYDDIKSANPYFMKEYLGTVAKPSYFVLAYDKDKSKKDKIVLKELQKRTNFEEGYDEKIFHSFLKNGLKEYRIME
jgi:thiol:disulfide interchange protein